MPTSSPKVGPVLALSAALVMTLLGSPSSARAATPPAPTPVGPANGASVLVPFTISWSAVTDPSGIVAYNWQVSPSSTFNPVIKLDSTSGATQDTVSGLANGTYFWRVQAVSGDFVSGGWSAARSFTVTGAGPGSPGTPTLDPPKGGRQFHPFETITFNWSAVAGADSYVFEASTSPSFPVATMVHINNIPNTTYAITFGDSLQGNWLARVYAVTSTGIEGVPSNTQSFSVLFSNPVSAPPKPIAPTGGATVDLPVTLSWTDVPNPQEQGYEVQIATDSGFRAIEDDIPLITPNSREVVSLTSGVKFWRVRAFEGDNSPTTAAVTAWSTTASFTVSQGPVKVTGISLTRTPEVFSGETEDGRIQLSSAAPSGGTVVTLTSSNRTAAPVPASVTVPAGFALSPTAFEFTTGQVTTPTPVTITATTGSSSVSTSITVRPPSLKDLSVPSTITGGVPVGGIVMLNGFAPAAGASVSLSSSSTSVTVPASVTFAAGDPSATFDMTTRAVTATTTVTITATWNGGSVSGQITLTPQVPPGSITISPTTTDGTNGSSGTVTLASPADRDVQVLLSSSDASVATVPPYVTIGQFAGGGGFNISTHNPSAPTTVTISASGAGVTKTATLTVNPFATGPSASALTLSPTSVTGGASSTATVTLSAAAPSGGASVALSSSNTAVATLPATATVPAGATKATFTVTSKAVSASSSATISAAYGGATKTAVLAVTPAAAPAAPTASALALSPTSVTGGGSSTATVTLSSAAPSGGASVTLSSSNTAAATVPASVTVAAGATKATFTVASKAVTASTSATISAAYGGATKTAVLTVTAASATTDSVAISRAEYDTSKRQLSVEATSTNASATLQVLVTSSGQLIGTLPNDGTGRYRGTFSWSSNPGTIGVKSSLGGSATKTVTPK